MLFFACKHYGHKEFKKLGTLTVPVPVAARSET